MQPNPPPSLLSGANPRLSLCHIFPLPVPAWTVQFPLAASATT